MSPVPVRDRLVEFFTLKEAERAARELPAEVRSAFARGLSLATQKREAAETLWPRGSMAEAFGLALGALEAAEGTLSSFRDAAQSTPDWLESAHMIVSGARARVAESAPPELEAEMRPAHEESFQRLVDALVELDEVTRRWAGGPPQVAQLRRKRWVAAGIGGVLAVVGLVRLLHVPTFSNAVASEEINPTEDPAKNAIDGDAKSSWFLPDGHPGWIDLTLTKPRAVRAVRIAQGNPPWGDRTTKDARVETYLGAALLKGVDVTLADPPSNDVGWTELAIESPVCDRIRFIVKTAHKRGGGLAELEVK
jgi:hypothetical protein